MQKFQLAVITDFCTNKHDIIWSGQQTTEGSKTTTKEATSTQIKTASYILVCFGGVINLNN